MRGFTVGSDQYIVACVHDWNLDNFKTFFDADPDVHLVTEVDQLNMELLNKLKPRYIFFPHWSWIVPKEITTSFDCVCFHMTDLPYGRGGSPLQNLIVRGKKQTKLSALKMDEGVDTGPIYLKKSVDLLGSAKEIYEKVSLASFQIMNYMMRTNITPVPQTGDVVEFKRRKPKDSWIELKDKRLHDIYDFIRMLDAPGYPKAKVELEGFVLEFEKAELFDQTLKAEVKIKDAKK